MTQPAQQVTLGTCFDCVYWQPLELGGYCHFSAPSVGLEVGLAGRVLWPRTLATDWCGQWSATTATRTAQVVDG